MCWEVNVRSVLGCFSCLLKSVLIFPISHCNQITNSEPLWIIVACSNVQQDGKIIKKKNITTSETVNKTNAAKISCGAQNCFSKSIDNTKIHVKDIQMKFWNYYGMATGPTAWWLCGKVWNFVTFFHHMGKKYIVWAKFKTFPTQAAVLSLQ